MRSNSLHPYELVAVESADELKDGAANLVLNLQRGGKHESMKVHVEKRDGGRYGLVSFVPAQG